MKIRYKLPESDTSTLVSQAVTAANEHERIEQAPLDVRFAAAVAGFGQLLRGSPYTESFNYDQVIKLAQGARGEDRFGYRSQFLQLVRLARSAAEPAIAVPLPQPSGVEDLLRLQPRPSPPFSPNAAFAPLRLGLPLAEPSFLPDYVVPRHSLGHLRHSDRPGTARGLSRFDPRIPLEGDSVAWLYNRYRFRFTS